MITKPQKDTTPEALAQAKKKLLTLCQDIVADDLVEQHEALSLQAWLDENEALLNEFPANVISARLFNHLDDGKLNKREASNLLGLLRRVIHEEVGEPAKKPGSAPYDKPLPKLDFCSLTFCMVGQFAMGSPQAIGADITTLGGKLCQCPDGSTPSAVAMGYFTGKDWMHGKTMAPERTIIDTAIRLRAAGKPVLIISEEHLMDQMIEASDFCMG